MKRLITLSLLALVAAPTLADPVTKTVTYDGPKGSGSKTTIVDREAGTRSLEGTATRNSDGATATRSRQSERTADGRSGSGSATRFNGNQRSYEYERVNSGNGFNTTGTATGANGAVYEYRARGRRGENRAGPSTRADPQRQACLPPERYGAQNETWHRAGQPKSAAQSATRAPENNTVPLKLWA